MTSFTPELLSAFALFAFVASVTPGPNNAMLMASGANFGLRATIPHLLGVVIGFLVLLLSAGFGLGGLFTAYPVLHDVLKLAGGVYLLWLAWKIGAAKGVANGEAGGRPQTFWQAASFQWVNPKAWVMAVGAVTTYTPRENYTANLLAVCLLFSLINLPCVAGWTCFGAGVRRFLQRPAALQIFNWTMAGLLVLSLLPLAAEYLRG